ncbi:MAG: PDZ domain-containing protein, partial [Salinivirgaceae bacterium]|nr:PDZ domain-containing protein [Salinivirgaceae bacterium]
MKTLRLTVIIALILCSTKIWAYEDARMMRFPDVNGDKIVFVYAGDIWSVDSNGGDARQLTSHKGVELFPKISPDGKLIAFSAEYSGNRQVWVMPINGGTPIQLTFYNDVGVMPPRGGFDNIVMGWTADSKNVFFRSNRTEYGDRMGRYFTVNIDGGLEKELPIPYGGFGTMSPDNTKIAFAYIDREFRTWKRYKGGRASNLWIYDLEKNTSEEITHFKGTDHIPTWFGDKIYFASDRELWLNIYSYDINTKEIVQITKHDTFDVMWPSGSNGDIVYEHGGYIYKLDTKTGTTKKIEINIRYDNPNTLPYFKNVTENINSMAISPSGNRVLFDARGDIFSVPAGDGTIFNLTNKQGVRSINPAWSPDGKNIAYISDDTGEYELYMIENKDNAKPVQLTKDSKGWKYQAEWSPDSKMLLFFDRSMRLQLTNVDSKTTTVIDVPTTDEIRSYTFSPDSRWVAYVKDSKNGLSAIWVYNIEDKSKKQLTDDSFNDDGPVFSKCGNYLYFTSNRDFNLAFSSFEFNYLYNNASRIYALTLQKDSPRLFEPRETLEEVATDKKEDSKSSKAESDKKESKRVSIDFDGINQRIVAFPMSSGGYWDIQAVDNGIVYFDGKGFHNYDIEKREDNIIMAGISDAIVSANGKKFLYNSGNDYGVASLTPDQKAGAGKLDLSQMEMRIEPRKEWNQIFNDGWRIFRDYFYVSNVHGVEWEGFREKYSALLPYLNTRFDLDYIFGELIAETNTGHAYVNYGDIAKVERVETGLLGAKLKADESKKRFVISKIFQGENWNASRRSPLTEQGIDVKEGDYLIAIDGEEVTTDQNPYKFLENKVDRLVKITVNSKPSSAGARTYTIKPISSELELMYLDWVNGRRALVDKLSGGRIGYIHVP